MGHIPVEHIHDIHAASRMCVAINTRVDDLVKYGGGWWPGMQLHYLQGVAFRYQRITTKTAQAPPRHSFTNIFTDNF